MDEIYEVSKLCWKLFRVFVMPLQLTCSLNLEMHLWKNKGAEFAGREVCLNSSWMFNPFVSRPSVETLWYRVFNHTCFYLTPTAIDHFSKTLWMDYFYTFLFQLTIHEKVLHCSVKLLCHACVVLLLLHADGVHAWATCDMSMHTWCITTYWWWYGDAHTAECKHGLCVTSKCVHTD